MKFHGIHQSQSGGATAPSVPNTPTPSPRRKTSPAAGPSSKKRKLDKFTETPSSLNTDDDEFSNNIKAESSTSVKTEAIKAEPVKEESTSEGDIADCTAFTTSNDGFQYPSSAGMGFDGANDSAMFDDFLAFGGSIKPEHGPYLAVNPGFADEGSAPAAMDAATPSGSGQAPHDSILIVDGE